jgi:RNA-directed DNA polymerase
VILIDAHPQHDWLLKAVEKRLREELAKLQVEINEEKSRIVDLAKGESIGFLGFEFRRIRSRRGAWRPNYPPKLKKRTEVVRKLKEILRRYQSQPVDRVIELINPILRGWVNYFAVGDSGRCFCFLKDWVETRTTRLRGNPAPHLHGVAQFVDHLVKAELGLPSFDIPQYVIRYAIYVQ